MYLWTGVSDVLIINSVAMNTNHTDANAFVVKMKSISLMIDKMWRLFLKSVFLCLSYADEINSEQNCSYQDVLNYLNLSSNNELYSMTRPVKNYKNPTLVSLEVLLYAILDVVSNYF